MKVLVFNPLLCDGCRVCEETCAQTWFKDAVAAKSAIHILQSPDQAARYEANVCTQCGECIDICPTLALKRDKYGIVRVDKKLCVGCLSCVGFCPILAMRFHGDYVVPFKCVACGKCAQACPTGALAVEEQPDVEPTLTERRMKAWVLPEREVVA